MAYVHINKHGLRWTQGCCGLTLLVDFAHLVCAACMCIYDLKRNVVQAGRLTVSESSYPTFILHIIS